MESHLAGKWVSGTEGRFHPSDNDQMWNKTCKTAKMS